MFFQNFGVAVAVDDSGNVYTTGSYQGTVDFDPGPGIHNLTSVRYWDIFVCKLNASGEFIWAKSMGGNGDDSGTSIAVDKSGNIYTTGYFSDTADFDPGTGVFNFSTIDDFYQSIFISKLDAKGNFVWAKNFKTKNRFDPFNYSASLALDLFGNVYTTGEFSDTVDFDPGPDVHNMMTGSSLNTFISKLDTFGNFVWAKQFEGKLNYGKSIAVDNFDNLYITGTFRELNDFDPGSGLDTLNGLHFSVYISKLTTSGEYVWTKGLISRSSEAVDVAVDTNGNIYTTGLFFDTIDFDPGPEIYDLTSLGLTTFINKLDPSGNFVWAKCFSTNTGTATPSSISVDKWGNAFVAGYFKNTIDFNPGTGVNNITSTTDYTDIYLDILNTSGNFIWAGKMGGISDDHSTSVTVDNTGNIYLTGYFSHTVDFNSGSSVNNITANGLWDIFVEKLTFPTVGILENKNNSTIIIYPDPSIGIFSLKSTAGISKIEIINMLGEIIYTKENDYRNSSEIDISSQPNGVYFIRLKTENNSVTKKIIINK